MSVLVGSEKGRVSEGSRSRGVGPELGAGAEGEGCLIGDDGDMGCWSRGVAGAGDSGGLTESSLVLIAGVPAVAAEGTCCGVAGMPVALGEAATMSGLG